jgi:hypothetical protein
VQLSNYAPLAGGANVVFDFFPANPTTWFVGTYIHVIVLWALVVHRLRVTPLILAASLIGEIAIRAVLMETAGHMVAYMALPNWSTIFLLGSWYGQRPAQPSRGSNARALLAASLLVVAIAGWSSVASTLPFRDGFPFFELALSNSTVAVLAVSVLVSGTYLALTWLLFIAVRPYAAPRPVRFIARNTLIIFLAHMPVYYLLSPQLVLLGIPRGLRAVILGVVVLVLLAFLSEFITRVLRPRELGRQLYGRWASSRIPAVSKSWQNS